MFRTVIMGIMNVDGIEVIASNVCKLLIMR